MGKNTGSSVAGLIACGLVVSMLGGCATESASSPGDGDGDGGSGASSTTSSTASGSGPGPAPEPTPCDRYCSRLDQRCQGADAQFEDREACLAVCALLPAGESTERDAEDNLDTLACRRHHLEEATANPALHCGHAGPTGDDACGTVCAAYCMLAAATCTGSRVLYPGEDGMQSEEACSSACAAFDAEETYAAGGPDGDTLACRFRALVGAAEDPARCADAGADSGSCVTP